MKQPIVVHGNTVVLNFKGTPNYVQWQNLMWNLPMISPSQAKDSITNAASLTTYSPGNPIGTGPYAMDSKGFDPTTRVVWVKKAHWWASDLGVSPSPAPKYIIDLVNTSNTNSLSAVLAGVEDLNNNYLPGVNQLVDQGKVSTYFAKAPYMLSANTAWLEPEHDRQAAERSGVPPRAGGGHQRQPDRDAGLRQPRPAGEPDRPAADVEQVRRQQLVTANGFKYNPSDAASLLTKAGYPKDSSGMFENKDGSKINLDISVPQGWSDWEAARDMIVASAKDAGIRITAKVKDFNTWQSDRNTGAFDLVIDNHYQISDNPWTYWNGIFHLPIITGGTGQTFANFEQYSNADAWALVQKLDKTPLTNTAAIKEINSSLETTLMKDLPVIPLWYNGMWAQFTSKNWTNWPASSGTRQYTPVMWGGYLQMTGIDMFTHLKKK